MNLLGNTSGIDRDGSLGARRASSRHRGHRARLHREPGREYTVYDRRHRTVDVTVTRAAVALLSCLALACGSRVVPAPTDADPQTESAGSSTSSPSGLSSSSTLATTESTGLSTSLDTALSTSGGKELGAVCSVLTQDCVAGLKCGPSVADDCDWEFHTCYQPADRPDELDQRCTLDPPCGVDTCSASNFCFEDTCMSFCDTPSHPCSRPREECLRYTGWVYVCVTRCSPLLQDCPEGLVCDYLGAAQGVGCLAHSPMPVGFHGKCESSGDCQPGLICVNSVIGCATDCCTPFCDVTDPNACDQMPGSACKPFDFFYPSPETENLGYCD